MVRCCLLLFFLLIFSGLCATHILGGEMHYEHLGSNVYRVVLKLYRDCGPSNQQNTQFDNKVSIGLYQGINLIQVIEITDPEIVELDRNVSNPCLSLPDDICIEEATYSGNFSLPESVNDFILVYQRCCRNASIGNISNSEQYGLSLVCRIPPSDLGPNSSPVFTRTFPLAFCLNDLVFLDNSAFDADGDSLVYSISSAYNGGTDMNPRPEPPDPPPYERLPWAAGFSEQNPLPSLPPVRIGSQNGQLRIYPTAQGAFNLAISVKEYRNGVFLSESIRDLQVNVTTCTNFSEAGIKAQDKFCKGLEVSLGDSSQNVSFWDWRVGSLLNPVLQSDNRNPDFTFPYEGNFTVYLLTNAGFTCADTASIDLLVREPLNFSLGTFEAQCLTSQNLNLKLTGSSLPSTQIIWHMPIEASYNQIGSDSLAQVRFLQAGQYPFRVQVSDGPCYQEIIGEILIESPFINADFEDQSQFCVGKAYQFRNLSQNTNVFTWVLPFDTSFAQHPFVYFPDTGFYPITLIAGRTEDCADTITKVFDIKPNYLAKLQLPDTLCADRGLVPILPSYQLLPQQSSYNWNCKLPNGNVVSGTGPTFTLPIGPLGTYQVELSLGAYQCEKVFSDSVFVDANPKPVLRSDVFDGCRPLKIQLQVDSLPHQQYLLYSGLGDQFELQDERQFSMLLDEAGLYNPLIRLISTTGCRDTVYSYLSRQVEVFPLPKPNFSISSEVRGIFDERASYRVLNESTQSQYALYVDGELNSNTTEGIIPLDQPGNYNLMLVQTDEHGCIDSISKRFLISGHYAYVPNSFTPDGDGINDYWRPFLSRLNHCTIQVYNRYGRVVYESNDQLASWDGRFNGLDCPLGIYTYEVFIVDKQNVQTRYTGKIHLIR